MQLRDDTIGFLIHSPEGCAVRICYLLNRPELSDRVGQLAREFIRSHFLITRNIRDYLILILPDKPDSHLSTFKQKQWRVYDLE